MYKELIKKIEETDQISIFRHLRPDGDAIFSAFALKEFIETNFKDKKVKCVGNEVFDIYPVNEKVSDRFIRNSLAIIVDCSNEERTDDKRFHLAKYRILIDHHPTRMEPEYGDLIIRDVNVAATCELLAKIFYSKEFKSYKLSKKCLNLLYCGLLTDSNSFKTASTTHKTLHYASKLVKDGDLNVSDLEDMVFAKDLDYFNEVTKIRNLLKIKDGVGYVIIDQKNLDSLGTTFDKAKNAIDEFACIKDIHIWSIFAYNKATGKYDGSIRSRRPYVINELAYRFNGGGHKNACGVKGLTLKKIHEFIDELAKIEEC